MGIKWQVRARTIASGRQAPVPCLRASHGDGRMSLHVLIVDDDRDHAESVADILEMRGYAIEIAGSGEAGVAKFGEAVFDVVLMDVKMPGMNGVEAFFAIRQIKPDAQVVMMTGFSVEELVERAMNNSAIGTLRKPLAIPQLLQTFEALAKAA